MRYPNRAGVVGITVVVIAIGGLAWLVFGRPAPPLQKALPQVAQPVMKPQPVISQPKTFDYRDPTEPAAQPTNRPKEMVSSQQDQEIVSRLEQQGVSHQNALHLTKEEYAISDDVFKRLSKASNWMPELKKATSDIITNKNGEPTMLRIYGITNDSVLREFGIEDGDIVALIDGEIPVFSATQFGQYSMKACRCLNDSEIGKPVSVTVLRNGRPYQLVYRLW